MAVYQHTTAKTYEVTRATTGGATTFTLAKAAFACKIVNTSGTATDSFDLQFNGGSAKFRIYGGKELILRGTEGFNITSITHTAVSGTPEIDAIFFEVS
jgi:hypothetical protein